MKGIIVVWCYVHILYEHKSLVCVAPPTGAQHSTSVARIQAATSITSLEGRLVSKQSSFVFAVSHLSYWALIMDTRVVNGPSQTFTVPREVEALVGTFSEEKVLLEAFSGH